ncbi:concanavalin A-like lectin/glucanase domain-containing protein [Neurospora hispaniola]|uniref:Concanavalin A-like lectin/glucanase domain-containing protein n=1 Tax=Neurospora hispaniola TaxID=588809 RepID=A0AAJ0I8C8_9PEZI|nr:concanavalin A-like lectin/glucanase domain-containing protein [Neurospora hispaniola]
MKLLPTAISLLGVLSQPILAQFTFTSTVEHNGVPVPQSETDLKPFEPGTLGRVRSRTYDDSGPKIETTTLRRVKRTNPTANSNNWCGSVQSTTSSNQIKLIHGTFQHPSCTQRPGVTQYPQAAAAWIGIDGDSWTSALLQAGTVCKINNSTGIVENEVWWQWVPNGAYTITNIPVFAGDWFDITINTTSSTAANIKIMSSRGYTYTVNAWQGAALARVDADWVVERPYYGNTLTGFAQFTQVWFQNAYATLMSGTNSLGITGAKQYQIPGGCASAEYDNSKLYAAVAP